MDSIALYTKREYCIVPKLAILVSQGFEKGTFIRCFRIAVVIALQECGGAYEAENYYQKILRSRSQLVYYQRLEKT